MTLAELLVGIVIITILAGIGAFAGDAIVKSSKAGSAKAAATQVVEQYTALVGTGSAPTAALNEAVKQASGAPGTVNVTQDTATFGRLTVSADAIDPETSAPFSSPKTVAVGVEGWCVRISLPTTPGQVPEMGTPARTGVLSDGMCAAADPTPTTPTAPPAGSKTAATAFLARASTSQSAYPRVLATGPDGSTFVYGYMYGSTQFGGHLLDAPTYTDTTAFLAKVGPDGVWQWAQRVSTLGYTSDTWAQFGAAASDGGVFVAFMNYGGLELGGQTYPAADYVLIARFTAGGQVSWVNTGAGAAYPGVAYYTTGLTENPDGSAVVADYYDCEHQCTGLRRINQDGSSGSATTFSDHVTVGTFQGGLLPVSSTETVTLNGPGTTVTARQVAVAEVGADARVTKTTPLYTPAGSGTSTWTQVVRMDDGSFWFSSKSSTAPLLPGWTGPATASGNFLAHVNASQALHYTPLNNGGDQVYSLNRFRTGVAVAFQVPNYKLPLTLGNGVTVTGTSTAWVVAGLSSDGVWQWSWSGDAAPYARPVTSPAGTLVGATTLRAPYTFTDGQTITPLGVGDILLMRIVPPTG